MACNKKDCWLEPFNASAPEMKWLCDCGDELKDHLYGHPHACSECTCEVFIKKAGSMAISEVDEQRERERALAIARQLQKWQKSWVGYSGTDSDITHAGYHHLDLAMQQYIPKLIAQIEKDSKYMASKKANWWTSLELLIPAGRRGLLVGPPGTGKSTTAARMLHTITGHAHRITMTEGTGIEDLIGMYQLKDGATIWCDGPAVKAMKEGTGLIIDEVDKHSAEVGSLFYALLDDEPQVTLPTGEHVIADEGYKVLCTSNANISSLPEAIIDRMEFVLLAMAPHPDAMEQLTKPEAAAVQNYYRGVSPTNWQWTGLVTLRRMRSFHKLLEIAKDEVIVAEAVFGLAGKEVLSSLVTSAVAGR